MKLVYTYVYRSQYLIINNYLLHIRMLGFKEMQLYTISNISCLPLRKSQNTSDFEYTAVLINTTLHCCKNNIFLCGYGCFTYNEI